MKTIISLVLLFVFFIRVSAIAQEISLEDAVGMALKKNLSLQAGAVELKTLDRRKRSNWNEFLPSIQGSGGVYRLNEIPSYASAYLSDPWNVTFSIGASIAISAGTAYRMQENVKAYNVGAITYNELKQSLIRDTRKNFLKLLLIKDLIDIYEEMILTAESRYQRAKLRFDLGETRKVDMLSYQVRWESMKPKRDQLITLQETSRLEFKRIIGMRSDDTLILAGEIAVVPAAFSVPNLIARYLDKRYDVRYLKAEIKRLQALKNQHLSETMTPTLSLSYEYNPYYNNPSSSSGTWNDLNGGLGIFLSLPLDSYIPNSKKNLKIKAVADHIEVMEIQLKDILQEGAISIESVVLQLKTALSAIDAHQLNTELAQENYTLIMRSYEVGEADYIQVQTAEDDYNTALITLTNERFHYAAGLQDLEYELATPLEKIYQEEGFNE